MKTTWEQRRRWLKGLVSLEHLLAGLMVLMVALMVGAGAWFHRKLQLDEEWRLALSPASLSLGRLLQQQEVRLGLELVNRSTHEVRIVGASSTCGCTVVPERILGQVISPGGRVTVPVAFHAGTRDGPVAAQVRSWASVMDGGRSLGRNCTPRWCRSSRSSQLTWISGCCRPARAEHVL
jgi:hypothetical protein